MVQLNSRHPDGCLTTAKTALFGGLARAALVVATSAASTSAFISVPELRASNTCPGAASRTFRGMSNTTLQGWTSHNGLRPHVLGPLSTRVSQTARSDVRGWLERRYAGPLLI